MCGCQAVAVVVEGTSGFEDTIGSPKFTSRNAFGIQETVGLIMTPLLCMIPKVRLCEVLKIC